MLRKLSHRIAKAERQWAEVLEDWILDTAGFQRVYGASQLYVRRGSNNNIIGILGKVADDISLAGSTAFVHRFITRLNSRFPISKVIIGGKIGFNGCEIYQLEKTDIYLFLRSYMSQIRPLFIDTIRKNKSRPTL